MKACLGHSDILTTFDQVVAKMILTEKSLNDGKLTLKAETLQNAFVSFKTQIAKNKRIDLPKQVCFTLIRDQINFYRAMLKIPKHELLANISTSNSCVKHRIYNCLVKKNERDIIAVFKQANAQFSRDELNTLLTLAQETHLYKLTALLN